MARSRDLLGEMRANPSGNWRIEDVCTLARHFGIDCLPPKRGDHFKIAHPSQHEILTIPARRPIKQVYIRKLVRFIEDVIEKQG